jgi:hypothetical protein
VFTIIAQMVPRCNYHGNMDDDVIIVKLTRPMAAALLIALEKVPVEDYPPRTQIELMCAINQIGRWLRYSLPGDVAGIAP